jgi:hypothetical protein
MNEELPLVTDTVQLVKFLRITAMTLEAHIEKVADVTRERDEAVDQLEELEDDVRRMRSALSDIEGTCVTVEDLI